MILIIINKIKLQTFIIIFVVSASVRVHERPSFVLQLVSKVFLVHAAQRHFLVVQVVHVRVVRIVRVLVAFLPFFTLHVPEDTTRESH